MCSTAAKMGISAKGRQLMRKASVLVASFSAFVSAVTALPNSKPLVLILIGAPGSGKNTQSAYLQKVYEIPVISADQLVKANPDAVASIQTIGVPAIDPRQDSIMNQLVQAKLKSIDTSRGFILDGYPATKDQADFLAGLLQQTPHPAPLVLQLDVPDSVAKKRLAKSRNPDDREPLLSQAIEDYHREMRFIQVYYPNVNIKQVNANQTREKVSQTIKAIVDANR
jgi:adenylate kinase